MAARLTQIARERECAGAGGNHPPFGPPKLYGVCPPDASDARHDSAEFFHRAGANEMAGSTGRGTMLMNLIIAYGPGTRHGGYIGRDVLPGREQGHARGASPAIFGFVLAASRVWSMSVRVSPGGCFLPA